jgi:para-nitrobenzyl esterase
MPGPIADTTAGRIEGTLSDGISTFKGVPYAAPPVGRNRFRPPQPLEHWSDVRETTEYGPSCPQPPDRPMGWNGEPSLDEDCLHLNVWTPFVPGETPGPPATDGGKRPVMFWIHGGGYAIGSGSWPLYDGANLARRGDVVVVTVNHRLGPFGYLHLADVLGDGFESSGNNGQLDLIAALEWVRDNIGNFGGDASNVTVFGESGGGAKITTLLATPSAGGLFHRAAIQSGPGLRASKPEAANNNARKLLDALGIGTDNTDDLWTIPAERFIEAGGNGMGPMALGPVVDGIVLPSNPYRALGEGTAIDVPVIVGVNRDEGAGALPPELDDAGLRERLSAFGEENVDEIIGVYRELSPDATNIDVLSFAITDSGMRAGSITLAERKIEGSSTPVFMYHFTYKLAGRAGHGYEIQFVFGNLGEGASATRQAVADAMSEAWIAFARTGDPSTPLVRWPAYTLAERSTVMWGRDGGTVEDDPSAAARELWRRLPAAPAGLGFRARRAAAASG